MDTLRLLFPVTLLAYCLFKARTDRVFLLGIPFLQFMHFSVFFERVKIFWTPGSLPVEFHTMLWLIPVWAICTGIFDKERTRSPNLSPFGKREIAREELPFLFLLGIVLINLVLTSTRYDDWISSLAEASKFFYMFIGYLLLRGILANSSRRSKMEFLGTLTLYSTAATVLMILHQGFQVPIYEGIEYLETIFLGQRITRTFWFISPLLIFSWAFWISCPVSKISTWLGMGITALGIAITYTRTSVISAAILLLLLVAIRFLKQRRGTLVARDLIVLVIFVGLFIWAIFQVLPVQTEYLSTRMETVLDEAFVAGNGTLRQDRLVDVWEMVSSVNPLLGYGFPSDRQELLRLIIDPWIPDSTWVAILFQMGLLGVFTFVLLFFLAAIRSWSLFLQETSKGESLGLIFFLFTVGVFMETFASWTFWSPGKYTMALWFFAFISTEDTGIEKYN